MYEQVIDYNLRLGLVTVRRAIVEIVKQITNGLAVATAVDRLNITAKVTQSDFNSIGT